MSIDEVRRVLPGWEHHAAGAVLSVNKLYVFHTWDFIPPSGSADKPLRITFQNGKLFMWGEPAIFDGDSKAPDSAR